MVRRTKPASTSPHYNIAPSQLIAVVALRSNGLRGMTRFRLGLLRSWATSPQEKPQPINARAVNSPKNDGPECLASA